MLQDSCAKDGELPSAGLDCGADWLGLSGAETRLPWRLLRSWQRHHALPLPRRAASRHPAGLRACLHQGRYWGSGHHPAVPLLCRHHGYHHGGGRQRHLLRHRHQQRLHLRLHALDLPAAHLPVRCGTQYVRSLGRRPLGHPGPHHVRRGCRPRCRPGTDGHRHRLG